MVDLGVDGIVLSNHGGRQLDRAPVPFHLLPTVARELGAHTEILVDTGIMSGADIVAAVALGARSTLIGRAYLYGLMAGGEAGVRRAIEILSGQLIRTMRLLGVTLPRRAHARARHAAATAGAGDTADLSSGDAEDRVVPDDAFKLAKRRLAVDREERSRSRRQFEVSAQDRGAISRRVLH